jgi:hypothetical protein
MSFDIFLFVSSVVLFTVPASGLCITVCYVPLITYVGNSPYYFTDENVLCVVFLITSY